MTFHLPRHLSSLADFVIPVFVLASLAGSGVSFAAEPADGVRFYEQKIRPLLIEHCYACHSEEAGERQGGLLLDRASGWLDGGSGGRAVVPGDPDTSLLISAVRHDSDLQMPPDEMLSTAEINLLEQWIRAGAPAPADNMGETDFSRLGDQSYLFEQAAGHWAFQPPRLPEIPSGDGASDWSDHPIDRFVRHRQQQAGVSPSPQATPAVLVRRLHYDLTGLPATYDQVQQFEIAFEQDAEAAVEQLINRLLAKPVYGQHLGRLWLDVVRYGDTDNNYRPDTRTPHYLPFAFSYRDYVIDSLNSDKPYDRFLKEQLAADLMGFANDAPELAALGFYAAGPYATRAQAESLDDWIDVVSRGLMGMTVACARCHDHKFEPIPTEDYYSLRGVFAAVNRVDRLDEKQQPRLDTYQPTQSQVDDYRRKRAEIEEKIEEAEGKKARGNNRSLAQQIRETELAELLLFHPGAPARAMVVEDRKKPPRSFVFIRGDATSRGDAVPRRFLRVLAPQQRAYPEESSGRLQLARDIASPDNPLTARVIVNRIWGRLIGSHLVATTSDFGLQGAAPTHPELLDWLAVDFMRHRWSIKHLVRRIATSQTYLQSSGVRADAEALDSENRWLWRANRKHLSIESIRDSMLAASGRLDLRIGGHPAHLWGDDYTNRRAVYGYVNRFNLDPTLRAFDFPAPVQTQPARDESITAFQALFTMNSPFVIDQANAIAGDEALQHMESHEAKVRHLFRTVLRRDPKPLEIAQTKRIVHSARRQQASDAAWPLVAQALLMCNEFQYVD